MIPLKTVVAVPVSSMSGTTGGLLGGGTLTWVVTRAWPKLPSLLGGRGSVDVAVPEATVRSVPDAGAVPVTVNVSVAPEAIEPTVQVTVDPATEPPPLAVRPVTAASTASWTETPDAPSGPRFTAVTVYWIRPPGRTVAGPVAVTRRSAVTAGGAAHPNGKSGSEPISTVPAITFVMVPAWVSKICTPVGVVSSKMIGV